MGVRKGIRMAFLKGTCDANLVRETRKAECLAGNPWIVEEFGGNR